MWLRRNSRLLDSCGPCLLGRICPKRRGLKPRWRGCLQETVRWPGVFVVFPVCSRCAFGVVLHGARADLLRFGHLARSLRRAGTRVGLSGGPGWGGALEGAWALSWTRACAANASSRLIMRAGASSSGMKSALREAVTVDGWTPPPLPASATEASRARPTAHPALDP